MSGEPITLVCLPFAGAGASFYRPWSLAAEQDGAGLRVLPPQLPGRERRIDEEPHRDLPAAVAELRTQLLDAVAGGSRVALFGHSLGAVLAFELARRVAGEFDVLRVFASGSPEPAARRADRATGLPDDEFLAKVGEFTGYQHEALDDPEMRELILPALRADIEMHENYTPSTDEPLAVPISALRGSTDTLVSADQAAAWAKVTSRAFDYVELPGGHMYLTESAGAVLRLIATTLAEGTTR